MKTSLRLASFLSLCATAFAGEAAYTAPLGYTTEGGVRIGYTTPMGSVSERLQPGMNIIGLRLHQTALDSGSIASIGKDFVELTGLKTDAAGKTKLTLIPGITYVLEITSGEKAGVIQEITRWEALRLSISDDLAAAGVKAGDQITIRKAATLNSVFNPRSTGLKKGDDPAAADNVMIPQGDSFGDFRQCFIISLPDGTTGWLDAATFVPVGEVPIVYPDGLVVLCKGPTPVDLVFSGEVKPGPTRSVVKPGLNLVASPFAAGGALQDLGLDNDLLKSDDFMAADKVWVADGPFGHFATYYLTKDNQWISAGDGEPVTAKVPVGSAILIERRGPQALFSLGDSSP